MHKWKIFALAAAITAASITGGSLNAHAQSVLTQGSTGGDVWDLQYRLQALNDYPSPLDGVFGAGTAAAVKEFQRQYGLTADGVAGAQTWAALHKYTLDQQEMAILAHIIYSEARGEPFEGQVAVGAVVLNRIHADKFPNDIRSVVFQPGAFTSISDGQYWLTPNQEAYTAALDAVRGWDPSRHALYYFNPNTATSGWIWSQPETVKIGNHIFAK